MTSQDKGAWIPISTAPKGIAGPWRNAGPTLLLTDGNSFYIGFWNGRTWDDGDFFNDLGEMTHWQHLPDLPGEDQSS